MLSLTGARSACVRVSGQLLLCSSRANSHLLAQAAMNIECALKLLGGYNSSQLARHLDTGSLRPPPHPLTFVCTTGRSLIDGRRLVASVYLSIRE